jgi:hypothetical protein
MTAEESHIGKDKRARAALAAAALVAYGSWSARPRPPGVVSEPGLPGSYGELKDWLRGHADRDPIDTVVSTALVGGILFYLAERNDNPGIATPLDGVLYIATSLSVGYALTHPRTELGKAIASLVQTVGPSMAARALDPPRAQAEAEREESLALQRSILAKLEAIHDTLADR